MNVKSVIIIVLVFLILFLGLILFGRIFKGNDNLITLHIGPQTVECESVTLQRCLQFKYSKDEEYQNLHDDIVGFNYVVGYEYEVLVEKQSVSNISADSSNFQYQYVSTLNKSAVSYIQILSPQTSESVDTSKEFIVKGNGRGLFENNVVIEIVSENGETWGPSPTIMQTEDIGLEGTWELLVSPINATGEIKIRAFSPSPVEDQTPYEDIVTVYGEKERSNK